MFSKSKILIALCLKENWTFMFYTEIDLIFATELDINKCLKNIKSPISRHRCAPISDLPSNMITMDLIGRTFCQLFNNATCLTLTLVKTTFF